MGEMALVAGDEIVDACCDGGCEDGTVLSASEMWSGTKSMAGSLTSEVRANSASKRLCCASSLMLRRTSSIAYGEVTGATPTIFQMSRKPLVAM